MAKRKLTKHQLQRIGSRRQNRQASTGPRPDDGTLGPEQPGLVICHFGTQADVEGEQGQLVRCHLRANLGDIAAGDRVVWRNGPDAGVIEAVSPRANELLRPDSYGKLKVVAANVTRAVVTFCPAPAPHPNLIDRYLVVAEVLGIEPLLVINKCDLVSEDSPIHSLAAGYKELGYAVHSVSAKNGHGMQALRALLSEGTSIFVGQSGVGKSSLVQTLLPNELIKIGKISEAEKKGRHTTTHATLYHFDFGGQCIDSPGIREFGLWHMSPQQVAEGFVEFREHIERCRFRDCKHEHEPGCQLLQALADGRISAERFASYRQIVASLDSVTIQQPKP